MCNMKYLFLLALAVSVSSRRVFDFDDEKAVLEEAIAISVSSRRVVNVDEKVVLEEEWDLFKQEHSKVYEHPTEERLRKKIFLDNKLKIAQHNQLYELGQVSFKLGLNEYSDMQSNEFVAAMCGSVNNSSNDFDLETEAVTFIGPDFDVPSSEDWRKKGYVTPVKNQGQCGSCWAFASTGCLEGQVFRKSGKLISLSEQNLVDCSGKFGNFGCNGGFTSKAYKYVMSNGGIDTEKSYSYEAKDANCRYNPKFNSGASVKGVGTITSGNEEELKKAVATVGPISVDMDASPRSFQQYKKGVYYDPSCTPTKLNHAVLVVGYGTSSNGQDYWIVKNSWGTSWGDKGYILMARNKRNHCGLATRACYPLV